MNRKNDESNSQDEDRLSDEQMEFAKAIHGIATKFIWDLLETHDNNKRNGETECGCWSNALNSFMVSEIYRFKENGLLILTKDKMRRIISQCLYIDHPELVAEEARGIEESIMARLSRKNDEETNE